MSADQIDFRCKVCGKECDSAPVDGSGAICPEHCEDHEYVHDRSERRHYCTHCGQEPPLDWYDCE